MTAFLFLLKTVFFITYANLYDSMFQNVISQVLTTTGLLIMVSFKHSLCHFISYPSVYLQNIVDAVLTTTSVIIAVSRYWLEPGLRVTISIITIRLKRLLEDNKNH